MFRLVAVEVALDSLGRQSSSTSSFFGRLDYVPDGGCRKRDGHQESFSRCPLPFRLFTDASLTDWGVHLQDLTVVGMWSLREGTPYQCAADEGSSASLECLPTLDHGKDLSLNEEHCHSSGIFEEVRGHGVSGYV